MTLSRGEVVWDGKEFSGKKGRGQFLRGDAPTISPQRV
jgi:dihydropyrimidinase